MKCILIEFGIFCAVLAFYTNAENISGNNSSDAIANHESQAGSVIKRSSHLHSNVFRNVKKFGWQPTWVKTWHVKKTYIPIWKRVWRPREIRSGYPKPLVLVKPRPRVIVKKIIHYSR